MRNNRRVRCRGPEELLAVIKTRSLAERPDLGLAEAKPDQSKTELMKSLT